MEMAVIDSDCSAGKLEMSLSCCICEECYHDFKEDFGWKKLDGWDIEW